MYYVKGRGGEGRGGESGARAFLSPDPCLPCVARVMNGIVEEQHRPRGLPLSLLIFSSRRR